MKDTKRVSATGDDALERERERDRERQRERERDRERHREKRVKRGGWKERERTDMHGSSPLTEVVGAC
jgi:hypothetical protein